MVSEKQGLKEIKLVKDWVKQEGNSMIRLAADMGYTSTVTILAWYKRGNLPHLKREEILTYIGANDGRTENNKRKNKKGASNSRLRT